MKWIRRLFGPRITVRSSMKSIARANDLVKRWKDLNLLLVHVKKGNIKGIKIGEEVYYPNDPGRLIDGLSEDIRLRQEQILNELKALGVYVEE